MKNFTNPEKCRRQKPAGRSNRGIALVIVLAILLIVTVLVVALLSLAAGERSSASNSLQHAQADMLADQAADTAMGAISNAIAQGSQPGKSWASEPGRIWVFDIAAGSGNITWQGIDLFSARPGADPDNVDLNAPSLSGHFPIAPPASGNTSATMKVGWNNVLRDPSQPAAKANPIVGRVAYWVDDESCKVNINTADGSRKGNDGTYGGFPTANATDGYSFGFGTPSEISLAGLPGLDQNKARAVADTAWNQEFNSPDEITRAVDSGGNQAVTRAMFETLRFDVTNYNSSPDLNFMGEPRIALTSTATAAGTTIWYNNGLGAYNPSSAVGTPLAGLVLDQLYPQPSQLSGLPAPVIPSNGKLLRTASRGSQVQLIDSGTVGDVFDYYVGGLITKLMLGTNLEGQNFTWPKFDGADAAGFAGKYTPRQMDSITLQIMDISSKIPMADQYHSDSLPAIIPNGWVSGTMVMGVGREPQLTEALFTVSLLAPQDPFGYAVNSGSAGYVYPSMRMSWSMEYYFPAGDYGTPPLGVNQFNMYRQDVTASNGHMPSGANYLDHPTMSEDPSNQGQPTGPGYLGSCWQDVLLTVFDQSGTGLAGLDVAGCPYGWKDADQAKAAKYHPYCRQYTSPLVPTGTNYFGAVALTGTTSILQGLLTYGNPMNATSTCAAGCYVVSTNYYAKTDHFLTPGTTSIRVVGGIQTWLHNATATHGYGVQNVMPFDSIIPELSGSTSPYNNYLVAQMQQAVLPVDITVGSIPGIRQYLLRSTDPMVCLFPGDWQAITDPTSADITMATPPSVGANGVVSYKKGGSASLDPFFGAGTGTIFNTDGDNPGLRPGGGGDPLSLWLPRQDPRIPKQARFPSLGALFSIRTGLYPDFANGIESSGVTYRQQHGVPFRCLNLAPSTQASQKTAGGTSYPDWALLDLFYVPFLPQKPYGTLSGLSTTVQPYRRLTYGGATVGRININNPPVPYPFALDPGVNTAPPKREALQALFYGLKPSNSYDGNGDPVYTALSTADASTLAGAVAAYQATNGPFFMAGQIANVPEVANYLFKGNNKFPAGSISRNDVVRDTVGAITTRSNVYSVWVVAQTVRKSPTNTNYGTFETGDKVTSEVRRHYLVERFLETGVDGVPGNAVNPTTANTPNTYTVAKPDGDAVTTTAPIYQPSLSYPLPYRWRVVAVENIQM